MNKYCRTYKILNALAWGTPMAAPLIARKALSNRFLCREEYASIVSYLDALADVGFVNCRRVLLTEKTSEHIYEITQSGLCAFKEAK